MVVAGKKSVLTHQEAQARGLQEQLAEDKYRNIEAKYRKQVGEVASGIWTCGFLIKCMLIDRVLS